MFHARTLAASLLAVASFSAGAFAQTVFTSDTSISDTNFLYDGQSITIRGCTVTINGSHSFANVTIERSTGNVAGVLTHTAAFASGGTNGLFLTVSGDVSVQGASGALLASRIDLTSKGHAPGVGLGAGRDSSGDASGAGHGGAGGDSNSVLGGGTYDSIQSPGAFGSGGGRPGGGISGGGAGGGALRLVVGGTLSVDGSIVANGGGGVTGSGGLRGGGGAGGALWITAGTLAGAGSITANGGSFNCCGAGGGGGGRIAIYSSANLFAGSLTAFGGAGSVTGGAGTILTQVGAIRPSLLIANNATSGATTEMSGVQIIDANLTITNRAIVGPPRQDSTLDLTILGDTTVDATGAISADGRGYLGGTGPGAGANSTRDAAGGAHGGAGANSESGNLGGGTYDSITAPTQMGSGGGHPGGGLFAGASGGGAFRFATGGTLTLNGVISANGSNAGAGSGGWRAGAGAGGAIRVVCTTFAGAGSVSVNGGSYLCCGAGGGGGGRAAIEFVGSTFTGTYSMSGGTGYVRGGAGTVYLKPATGLATLIVDNGGTTGESTELSGDVTLPANLIVRGGALLGPTHGDDTLHLTLSGDVTVAPGATIGADYRGFAAAAGPQPGANSTRDAAGAGHGGAGGNSDVTSLGGGTYDSITAPTQMGSGGGNPGGGNFGGGRGGGALWLTVGNALTVDGRLSAQGENGTPAQGGWRSGAGAGGALRVSCNTLAGSGVISVNGGSYSCCGAGGGGGGRIAIDFTTNAFSGAYSMAGGAGAVRGGAGTCYLKPATGLATLIIDNGGFSGESTELSGVVSLPANLIVRGNAVLGPTHEDPTLSLRFDGDATIEANSAIGADLRGFPSASGPQPGSNSTRDAAGAGHGGAGVNSDVGSLGGGTYDDIVTPTQMGSGGGNPGGGAFGGGRGGGAINLSVGGTLTVTGEITADGESGYPAQGGWRSGGGAGGSLLISCGTLAGTGTVSARGGSYSCCGAGAGGGGRVAIIYATNSFGGAFDLAGGTSGVRGGAGTLFLKPTSGRGTLIIDNGGVAGETTELSGENVLDANLIVRGGGILGPTYADPTLHLNFAGNVTVEPTGSISANGRGYPTGEGLGAGGNSGTDAAGGGHGGRGGNSSSGAPGGVVNDASERPVEMGSGGGNPGGGNFGGGAGGGRIDLTVGGTLLVNGTVSANGAPGDRGAGGWRGGAGAGGSLFITAGAVDGAGSITANGGNYFCCGAGGGGGGRIAINSCTVLLPIANITANGGVGAQAGSIGSIVPGSGTVAFTEQPVSGDYRGSEFVQLHVEATGDGPLTYQWRRRFGNNPFEALSEGQDGGRITNVNTDTLFIQDLDCSDGAAYDCLVCDSCGCAASNPATIGVVPPGDFNQDGGIDGADVDDFFAAWGAGLPEGDINQDGGIDGSDVSFFFEHWERGC
ncbi:MAG: hypothetical protein JSR77_01275 [Planctomycetes bacterium]|nr:hypothetical protein [Planctomycetota bacterium]